MSVSSSASVNGGHTGSQNKGYQNDTLNPYFLHPNENPGNVLVTPLLSGSNYHSWSCAMTVALRSKHKLHFVNGSPSDDDHDSIAWDRCNTMIMSWLCNSVEPEIAQSILWMDSASDIWKDLKDHFYQGDIFRISDIQEEIYSLKQGDCSISTYYTRMKKLWQELDNFRPIPESNCIVDCNVVAKMKEYKDSDQKERQLVTSFDESKLLAAMGSSSSGRGQSQRGGGTRGGRSNGGRGRGNKLCTHCGQTNHVIENCWKKYGYPPPHLQHLQEAGKVNNINGNEDEVQSVGYVEEHIDSDSSKLSFTPEQHKALLAFLQGSGSLPSHSINHITTNHNNGTVPKLTCLLKCHLVFDNDKCVIQDNYSKRMIGAAKLNNGLYLLTQPSISLGKSPDNPCIKPCLSIAQNNHVDCNMANSFEIPGTQWTGVAQGVATLVC
ncbi:hypothetical protein L195_g023535, partial [Trifolium pratense]